ncbi:MAG: hypothetical protein ACI4TX_01330 [Christensenellales bacterium]
MNLRKIKIEHIYCVSELMVDENNQIVGDGVIIYTDGRKYEGKVDNNGLPNGKGKYTYANNDTLEGEFTENGSLVGVGFYNSSRKYEFKQKDVQRIF